MSGWELRGLGEAGGPSLRGWLADAGHSVAQRPIGDLAALAKVTEQEMS